MTREQEEDMGPHTSQGPLRPQFTFGPDSSSSSSSNSALHPYALPTTANQNFERALTRLREQRANRHEQDSSPNSRRSSSPITHPSRGPWGPSTSASRWLSPHPPASPNHRTSNSIPCDTIVYLTPTTGSLTHTPRPVTPPLGEQVWDHTAFCSDDKYTTATIVELLDWIKEGDDQAQTIYYERKEAEAEADETAHGSTFENVEPIPVPASGQPGDPIVISDDEEDEDDEVEFVDDIKKMEDEVDIWENDTNNWTNEHFRV
ncbi:hypothetical protein VKT23_001874 [Stygiomarasmius scandens]|uniref:Uncharacterized protein n=1 Tax=Marasmiellus scandens TaxID=2682957 RepID=A0ABR1K312_9AGAR